MASFNIPVPRPLELNDGNTAENWKKFRKAFTNYELASGYNKKNSEVRVALLLSVIGEPAVEVFETFTWANEDDGKDITKVVEQFEIYCIPRKNILFETYRFTCRKQGDMEPIDTYLTGLRKIAENCSFTDKDRRLRDQLVFGIRDDRVRERLLRDSDPKLKDVIDTVRASEFAAFQSQQIASEKQENINAVQKKGFQQQSGKISAANSRDEGFGGTSQKLRCKFCGRVHEFKKELCPAYGKTCNSCKKMNHFEACCKKLKPEVKQVTVEEDEEAKTVGFHLFAIENEKKVHRQTKTFRLPGVRKFVTFHIDTGASCNVLPHSEYIKITNDFGGTKLKPEKIRLNTYGGVSYVSEGTFDLVVEHRRKKVSMLVHVVRIEAQPLLSLQTCKDLGIIKVLDSDQEIAYQTGHQLMGGVTKQQLLMKYPKVFCGVGKLKGTYKIQLDEKVPSVIHAPRKFPVSLRQQLNAHLDELEKLEIIAKVTEPTDWVSSLMVVRDPNKFRICIDPRDLNLAIRREHYQLPCLEEVTTRLSRAKVFTVLDAKKGFWQVELEEASSYLTTFHTPFGRYRWKRMPFGISSAPEVWQRKMHEFIEGLAGVEVIADDYLIVGCGDTLEEATKDHDLNINNFLQKAQVENLTLNADKLRFKMQEVPFIGHVLTTEGLKPDPKKVEAIRNMAEPTNEKDVRRFLGMVQYLAKFLPEISLATEPLRRLTDLDSEWQWSTKQKKCFEIVKSMISEAPMLAYYDVTKPVVIQADASEAGLGAVLLQDGRPIHFTSRALTKTEQRYAQIEKELLAIVHACSKFDHYIYGRSDVEVHSDHKPLEVIFKKAITVSPKRLQRMLLFLQKYQLTVCYKRGSELYIADTLSRANLPICEVEDLEDVMAISELKVHEDLKQIKVINSIPNGKDRIAEIADATTLDVVLQDVLNYVRKGWPNERCKVNQTSVPYYGFRHELTEDDGVLLKGQRIVVPTKLRAGVLQKIHLGHTGVEGSLRRARDYVFWPRMNADVKQFVSQCDICNSFRPAQQREPLASHDVVTRPWEVVSSDIFELQGNHYILAVDHYSGFFEFEPLSTLTSTGVVKFFKKFFSRYGIPDKIITDNGPQYSSLEFKKFTEQWKTVHITSSPLYPRSNGKAESAVKICKQLMKKSLLGSEDFYEALLHLRNTPDAVTGLSPAQKSLGRRTRTVMPTRNQLLYPSDCPDVSAKIALGKAKSARNYNRGTKLLKELSEGNEVCMQLPGSKIWSKGKIGKKLPFRSYEVIVDGKVYRRNRQAIREWPTKDLQGITEMESLQQNPKPQLRRSDRIRKMPVISTEIITNNLS